MNLPETVTLPLSVIKPYPNNPRTIPDSAVDAVAESIKRYGYQQPIVVDRQNVIIVGHTRFAALQKLGVTEAPVYVADLTEDKAREYRLVDNRTSEMGQWDHGALVVELREFEKSLLDSYFPDVDLEIQLISDDPVTQAEVAAAKRKVENVPLAKDITTTDVVCPSCFHTFQVRTDSLPGLTQLDLKLLADAQKHE